MAKEARPEIGYTGARFGGGRARRSAAAPAAGPAADPGPDVESPRVGYTGARFGGASRRRVRERTPEVAESVPAPVPEAAAGPSGRSAPPVPPGGWPTSAVEAATEITAETVVDLSADPPADPPAGSESIRVRPYVFTGGRTRGRIELHLETLVSAGPRPPREHHAVVELCRTPVSVAEVAALMNVPIGVSRVVLGDLAAQGAVTVHETGIQDVPELAFLERVLTGLRRL